MAPYPINGISLCSGAGGLELGVSIAEPRARTVCYVEREAYAAACLVARMEDETLDQAPVWSDVTTFDATAWRGLVDIVTSGDPCQPNSVAGKGLGADDDRWMLDHILRIFDDSGATRFFRENVTGNAHGQLAYIVPALERLGCRVAAGIFSAAEAGASHRRERLFIMADRDGFKRGTDSGRPDTGADGRNDVGRRGAAMGNAERPERRPGEPAGNQPNGHDTGWPEKTGGAGEPGEAVGNAEDLDGRREQPAGTARRGRGGPAGTGEAVADAASGRSEGDKHRDGNAEPDNVVARSLPLFAPGPTDPRWPAILAGAPHLEPAIRRMAHGLAFRVDRLRLIGNGVFPLEAAYAYRMLDALLAQAGSGQFIVRAAAE